jgi:hypothetical protein
MVDDAASLILVLNCFFEHALFLCVLPTQTFPRDEKYPPLKKVGGWPLSPAKNSECKKPAVFLKHRILYYLML